MKRNVLLIGGAPQDIVERAEKSFNLFKFQSIDQLDKASIEAIMTNGHDGVPNHLMQALPNLKIISCNGVGYDAIDVEKALVQALKDKTIKAAALDVFENEPEVSAELLTMDNVTLQPHMASATFETRQAMGNLTIDNIIEFMDTGTAITPVPEMN